MAQKLIMTETLEHREAFEYYYGLGETRSLQQVANFTGKSMASLKRWSVSFNWAERVKLRDIELGNRLEEKTNHTILVSRAEYRGVIRTLVDEFKDSVADGKIKIRSIKDFDMIVRLDMELMGVDLDDEGDGNLKSLAEVLSASAALIRNATGTDTGGEDGE